MTFNPNATMRSAKCGFPTSGHQSGDSESWKPTSQVSMSNTHQHTMGPSYLMPSATFPTHHMPMPSDMINHMSLQYLRISINHFIHQQMIESFQGPTPTHVQSSNPSSKSRIPNSRVPKPCLEAMAPLQVVDGQIKPCQTTNIKKLPNNKVE